MKIKKLLLVGLSAAITAAFLSACAEKKSQPAPEPENSAPGVEETAAPQITVEAIYGKVTDATMSTVTLLTEEGDSYTIAMDDDTVVHSGDGIAVDDPVEVIYTGSLADNSAVAESVIVTSEAVVKAAPAGDQEKLKYVDGPCIDETMNVIQVEYKGVTYALLKTDSTVVVGNVSVDDMIRVFHKGDIADGVEVTKIVLISKADANETEDFEVKKIYGTIQDAANASLAVLETDGGKTVQVVKTDDTKQKVESSIGAYVEVTYKEVTEDGYPIALEIN